MVVRATWIRLLGLGAAAVLAGCAVAPTAVFTPTLAPRAEALSYFPEGAPLVAVVRTDPQDAGLRRIARGGLLADVAAAADREGLLFRQLRPLLGNDAAVGLPSVGGAPLGVLVTRDAELLRAVAHSRVVG